MRPSRRWVRAVSSSPYCVSNDVHRILRSFNARESIQLTVSIPTHVRDLPTYGAGRPISEVAREFGISAADIVKLASNENPLGMSEKSKAAIASLIEETARYPDPNGFALRQGIASGTGLPIDWITLGSGSSEILEMAARAFLDSEAQGLISQYAFTVYSSAIKVTGAKLVTVPAVDFGHDLVAMARAIVPQTRLIYVANPNNPTGTYFSRMEFDTFMKAVDGRAVVVLDEAYQEYLAPADRFDAKDLVERHANLIVSRTFSKAHGLAGLRVGYALGQAAVTEALNKVRPTFNVNNLAQAAALAALRDDEFLEETRRVNDAGLAHMVAFCDANGLQYVPSKGNFLLIHVGEAAKINARLLQRGIIVRPVANYGLGEWLRISIGTENENQRFFDAMSSVLAEDKN